MASATDTTKSDRRLRRIDLWRSRIARTILFGNLAGLAVLIAGALWLSETRAQLIQAKIDSLTLQGELISNVLAETATVGDPAPALVDHRARQVLQRLMLPQAARVRLVTPNGFVVADTAVLADQVSTSELPAPGTQANAQAAPRTWRLSPWRPDFTAEGERKEALSGEIAAGQRYGDDGARVVSVSLPVQRVQAVVAVLTLEAGDVDDIVQAERLAMAPFIVAAAAIALFTSAVLALMIAQPLRKLANAADSLRLTGATRLELPDTAKRKDEIGDLASSLEMMTAALAERIDANERFAADVAHEIKNPLTSIRSAVETARAVSDPAAREKLFTIIAQDVGRLDRLITDIAQASYIEAETARSAQSPVDLVRLAAELCDTYAQTRKETEAAVVFNRVASGDVLVLGQDGPLGQVLRNLVDNAKSFSPADGVVTVTLLTERRKEGRFARLEVSDQGPGIPDENLESIFRRFYTDRPKGTAFGKNSGLGLSIARQIVEAHKGRIWAENIEGAIPGERMGARFIMELPQA
jgi:two-component system sensor histidine kinase ChvG